MNIVTCQQAQQELSTIINQANDDHTPITITQNNGKHAVLISTEDFAAYQETAYLLRSPENAKRLLTAFNDVKQGNYTARQLVEIDD